MNDDIGAGIEDDKIKELIEATNKITASNNTWTATPISNPYGAGGTGGYGPLYPGISTPTDKYSSEAFKFNFPTYTTVKKYTASEISQLTALLNDAANELWCAIHKIFEDSHFLPHYISFEEFASELQTANDKFTKYASAKAAMSNDVNIYGAHGSNLMLENLMSRGLVFEEKYKDRSYLKLNLERKDEVESSVFLERI